MTDNDTTRLAVRSVHIATKEKLAILRRATRLTSGSLIDDAIDDLWEAYIADGHDLDVYAAN